MSNFYLAKNVGLITIHGIPNYGSALQTYATVKAVQRLGYNCTVIDYKYPTEYHLTNAPHYKFIKDPIKDSIRKRIARKVMRGLINEQPDKKIITLNTFLKSHVEYTRRFENQNEIMNYPPSFEIYLTGSDQVWNPKYCHDDTTYLLPFAPDSALKIAYASSFGANNFLTEYKRLYSKYLSRYDRISVREASGIDIVNELTGKQSKCVLDPTLLLSPAEWDKIAVKKSFFHKPYILCYLLGYSFNPFPYANSLINELHKITGYDVIFIGGDPLNALIPYYHVIPNARPEEFLSLFRDASFIVTTSFHGTSFALNYSKPFLSIVNDESTTDDRQFSLMRMLQAETRAIVKGQELPSKNIVNMDYSNIIERLIEERAKSFEYLASSLAVRK